MTDVFDLADRVVEQTAAADPLSATNMGVAGYDHLMTDFSPDAAEHRATQARGWLADLDRLTVTSDDDRLAAAVLRERLGARLSMHEAGEHLRDINVVWSLVQAPRDAFLLMSTTTDEDWADVAARLEALPHTLDTVVAAYRSGIAAGLQPARRQVVGAAKVAAIAAGLQAEGENEPASWFDGFVGAYAGTDDRLRSRLAAGATGATGAYAELSEWLRDTYADAATERDAVGADRYARMARIHSGIDLDLAETYAWGWADLGRITARMNACAAQLYGGVTPAEAQARLDRDPEHTIQGAEQARDWLQRITDDTIASFNGRFFDIPEQMLVCEAMLEPSGGATMPHYTAPSEDFSRPGRTWLPVNEDKLFSTWWLIAAWYHEAVPGHHLQVAYTMTQMQRLSRFQRVEFVSGHAEGWALYAERLMDELGYYDHPAIELGYLSGQAMRACRVILDIGLHLELAVPADADAALLDGVEGDPRGMPWNRELARQFLAARGVIPDRFAANEVDRYLGLPGQAISYKVGERVWLAARQDAEAREGAAFDLKAWHMRALALGSVGLGVLREELARV